MMTRRERFTRLAGLVATLLPLAPGQVVAQRVVMRPDTVTTVLVADTVPGFGAEGGVSTDALAPGDALTEAPLELLAPGS